MAAITVVILGLVPILGTPPLGDDPITIAQGLGRLWGLGGLPQAAWESAAAAMTGDHVLPVGGAVTALEVFLLGTLMNLGIPLTVAWGVLRVVMIVSTLLSFSWALCLMLFRGAARNRMSRDGAVLAYFILTSGCFFALMQVHAPYSQDPVLAYGISSWFALTLSFLYLGLLSSFLEKPQGGAIYLLSAAAVGLLGSFTYEPVAIAVGISVVMALLWIRAPSVRGRLKPRVLVVAFTSMLVLLVFAAGQLWRLSQPLEYTGTTPGFLKMALPTWINSMVGIAPLMTWDLVPDSGISTVMAAFYFILCGALILVGVRLARGAKRPPAWTIFQTVTLLWLFVGTTVALYAVSSKYQLEIGTELGKTYLFYGLGLIVLSGSLAVVLHMIAGRSRVELLAAPLLAVLAFTQWTLNSKALTAVEQEWSWTRPLLDSLDGDSNANERCELVEDLRSREVPVFFLSGVDEGMTRAYLGRYSEPYCSN